MTLAGKGFFTINLPDCEGGDPGAILAAAQAAGLSHVILKIADGEQPRGLDASGIDLTAPVVQALRAGGMAVWGWHSIYGSAPAAEASAAIHRIQALDLDGYVVATRDAYERPGMSAAARLFMHTVRTALSIPIALSSFRFPNYHPALPWSTFLEFCDLHMPLVTWEQAHDAGAQLRESKRQCDALPNARPYIPTGTACTASGWSPTAPETLDFISTAQTLGLAAVNFFYWDGCRSTLPLIWQAIADYVWPDLSPMPVQPTPSEPNSDAFLDQFVAVLNTQQPGQASALYDPDALQVRADQILSGVANIQTGYAAFFDGLPPGSIFCISQAQVQEDARQFTWKAGPFSGETTLVLESGKIILDYTFMV